MTQVSGSQANSNRLEAEASTPLIKAIRIVGGFLDGAEIDLSAGLNCIIGGRGTGKTTVLELVRFVFAGPTALDGEGASSKRVESLLAQNLGGGRVEATVATRDGIEFVVTRSIGEEPIVLDADRKPTEIALRRGGILHVDVYSQNEIESIADCGSSQLALLDSFETEEIEKVSEEIRSVEHSLDTNAGTIGPLQSQIASLAEELAALPSVEEKLRGYADPAGNDVDGVDRAHTLKALRDRERRSLTDIESFLSEYAGALGEMRGQIKGGVRQAFSNGVGTGPNAQALDAIRKIVRDCGDEVDATIESSVDLVKRARMAVHSAGEEVSLAHDQQELEFRALMDKHQKARSQAVERSRLERLRNDLLAKQRNRDDLIRRLEEVLSERTRLLERLSDLRNTRFGIRQDIARQITKAVSGSIRVTVTEAGDRRHYRRLLEDALRNNRLKQGVVADKLTRAFWPAQLAGIVRVGDLSPLVTEADLNSEQAQKVIEALRESKTLLDLESVDFPDLPLIELKIGDEFRESQRLSKGQKCTTILPILLLESERPLLIDQPEDNIDNGYIVECVIQSILRIKVTRQLIFVTHNPNIPVLGDAERVFVLTADERKARIAKQGSVDECRDEIVSLLEGGEEAFQRRHERYGGKS
ncbi:MAG: AAA family ATPase [Phycisphaerales bacterium]|nr:AAA family ATPase [Phycisphaerales bacterium]